MADLRVDWSDEPGDVEQQIHIVIGEGRAVQVAIFETSCDPVDDTNEDSGRLSILGGASDEEPTRRSDSSVSAQLDARRAQGRSLERVPFVL